MTKKHAASRQKDRPVDEEVKRLLVEINQKVDYMKVDYIIEMLRDEELRYPYHRTFVASEKNRKK
jgi:hypothetical protein